MKPTSPSPSSRRWKVASALLAALAGYALFLRGGSENVAAAPAEVTERSGAIPRQLLRPIHISAEHAGISTTELVDQLHVARTVKDVNLLAEKLGLVGDDAAIKATLDLLADTRRGVPEALLGAYGRIGTERAVSVLVDHVDDDRPAVRNAAITALGSTQSRAAEKLLVERAQKQGDPAQTYAIQALGKLGTDEAVEVLARIAKDGDFTTANAAVYALGQASTPAADDVLLTLIGSPDVRIAAAALTQVDTIDKALLDKLANIVKNADPQMVNAALSALGKAGEEALPVLREAVLHGSMQTRWMAVNAIGQVGGQKSIALLGEIMTAGDRQSAMAACAALANIGGSEARELIINAALSDRAQVTGALQQLAQMDGEDVDAALLKVIKEGSSAERRAALPRLLKAGNEDALQIAIDLAAKGSRNERYEAMRLLADAGSGKAWDALVDIAGKAHGQTRVTALDMLARQRPGDPALEALLGDSLFSGRRDEAQYAAGVLGRIGTEPARQALIAALTGKDKELAAAAANALGQGGLTDSVKSALLSAARDNPAVKLQVMQQLINAGQPEGLRLAEEVLDGGKATPNAHAIVWALQNNGSPEARRLLERAVRSSDPQMRMAAISTLGQNADDRSTETLLSLARDNDPQVRRIAIQTLGQVGSERAQLAIIEATRNGKAEERIAAISGLAQIDDTRASEQLANLMRDSDPQVAQTAVNSAYNGGPEVDRALISIVSDPNATPAMRTAAASQLRGRGTDLDDSTEQTVTKLVGKAEFGGMGYGGFYGYGRDMIID